MFRLLYLSANYCVVIVCICFKYLLTWVSRRIQLQLQGVCLHVGQITLPVGEASIQSPGLDNHCWHVVAKIIRLIICVLLLYFCFACSVFPPPPPTHLPTHTPCAFVGGWGGMGGGATSHSFEHCWWWLGYRNTFKFTNLPNTK